MTLHQTAERLASRFIAATLAFYAIALVAQTAGVIHIA